jgi:hypothetical protein
MGQAFVLAIAIAILVFGVLFAGLFQMHTRLDRASATVIGFVVSLAIVVAIEAFYLSIGQW